MHRGIGGEAGLEERMKTMQAKYKAEVARLAEDNAKQETRLIVTVAGLLAFAVAVLGLLIAGPSKRASSPHRHPAVLEDVDEDLMDRVQDRIRLVGGRRRHV